MTSRDGSDDAGLRVSHLFPNDLFYAHLSLYAHARGWAADADVLDVGCGTGYGAAYLKEHGARSVLGVDVDPVAVEFAKSHFAKDGVQFRVADAAVIGTVARGEYDLVVALNALEHIADVEAVLDGVTALMRPQAAMVVAVPPVTTPRERLAELANPHHLNVWSPRQWRLVVGSRFEQLDFYRHVFARTDVTPDFRNDPEHTHLRETDFVCERVQGPSDLRGTYSVVMVGQRPIEVGPSASSRVMVDGSVSRKSPRLVPLPPDMLDAPVRPWRTLPAAAMALLRNAGPGPAAAALRSWAVWRLRRALALRELRRR